MLKPAGWLYLSAVQSWNVRSGAWEIFAAESGESEAEEPKQARDSALQVHPCVAI